MVLKKEIIKFMIINRLALIVNDFIVSLYSNGIHFYQVILGLIIFNVIVYIICLMINQMKRGVYR